MKLDYTDDELKKLGWENMSLDRAIDLANVWKRNPKLAFEKVAKWRKSVADGMGWVPDEDELYRGIVVMARFGQAAYKGKKVTEKTYEKYLTDVLNEGWTRSPSGNLFTAWASDVDGHMKYRGKNVKCPKCGKELSRKDLFSNPKRHGEEIASFENICSCGAKLLVWND